MSTTWQVGWHHWFHCCKRKLRLQLMTTKWSSESLMLSISGTSQTSQCNSLQTFCWHGLKPNQSQWTPPKHVHLDPRSDNHGKCQLLDHPISKTRKRPCGCKDIPPDVEALSNSFQWALNCRWPNVEWHVELVEHHSPDTTKHQHMS